MKTGLLLALFLATAMASTGDRLVSFRNCVSSCESITCGSNPETSYQLPMHLRLLFWDCSQNCDYNCQRITTRERINEGLPVVQYHGKWPFIRFYGVQEPASVLFSILNFIPHLQGLRMLMRTNRDDSHYNVYMRKYYSLFAIIGMNAWLWSTVFHTRDFILTERLDYFSAGLTILYGFFTAVVRIFRLDTPEKKVVRRVFSVACILVYAAHVGYLSLIRFSYSYNMAFGVVVGLLQNALWTYHSFKTYNQLDQHPHPSRRVSNTWALWPFFIVTAISAGMGFELFDFAPLGFVLDAHALWHAATVLPTYWWYWWMKKDINYMKSLKAK